MPRPTRWERFALPLLLLFPILLLADAWWPGNVAVTWDTATQLPWSATAEPWELEGPRWNEDAVRENLSYRMFVHDALGRGEIPWWSPYNYGGTPFLAMSHVEVLYPLTWLVLPLGPYMSYGALLALHLSIAGLGMWLFLRAAGVGPKGAAVGALVFMLNGMFATRTGHPQFVATGCWLPFVLWGIELTARRQRPAGVLVVALATAMSILAGHPSVYVYGFYFIGGYLIIRTFVFERMPWGERIENGAAFGAGFLIAIALTSVQLVATLEFSQYSDRAEGGIGTMTRRMSDWEHILRMVFPDLYGGHRGLGFWNSSRTSYMASTLYAGVAPLLIAGVGAFQTRRGRPIAALVGVFLAIMFVPLVFQAAWFVLPGFKFSRVDRLSIGWYLGVAILAAVGTDHLLNREGAGRLRTGARLAGQLILSGLVLGAVSGAVALSIAASKTQGPAQSVTVETLVPVLGLGVGLWALASVWIATSLQTKQRTWLFPALLALVVVDLGWFTRHNLVIRDATRIFRPTDATDFLQSVEGPSRVAKLGGRRGGISTWTVLPANTSLAYGIEDLEGFGPLHSRVVDVLLHPLEPQRGRSSWHVRPFIWPETLLSPTLDVAGIRFVLTPDRLRVPGWDLVHDGDLRIYENSEVLPRARYVPGYVVIEDVVTAAQTLHDGAHDPRAVVLLEEPPGDFGGGAPTGENDVAIVERGLNHVHVRKTGPDPGFVVLADMWYPGWRGWVDGVEVPLYRANVAFRAVPVPAGDHDVAFEYRPRWWPRTLAATGLGGAAVLGLAGALVYSRLRRNSREASDPAGNPSSLPNSS